MSTLLLPPRKLILPTRGLIKPRRKFDLVETIDPAECMSRFMLRKPPTLPPVAFLNQGAAGTGFATGKSWSHATGFAASAATNIGIVSANYNSSSNSVTATWGSTAMINQVNNIYTSGLAVAIFYLFDPPTGTQTVTFTSSAGGYIAANSYCYTGVISIGGSATGTNTATLGTTGTILDLWHIVTGNNSTGTPGVAAVPSSATLRLSKPYSAGVNYPYSAGDAIGTDTSCGPSTLSGTSGTGAILLKG